MAHIRFQNSDEEYELSESEDEYTEKDKSLLKKVRQSRKSKDSDEEDAVFNVDSGEDSNESDIALSDIDGQNEDDLPNIKAWGKDKKNYYSTDYIDPDYGGFQGKDAALAELEEEEARTLQLQLAQQLDDDDFSLETFDKKVETAEEKEPEEIIKTDISQLSSRQKLQLLQKESPEFFGLIKDFKDKMIIVKDYLKPLLNLSRSGKLADCEALNFVTDFHQLILNYCTNIYMYLLLKASKTNMQSHPVVKRLYQYRQLLEKMEAVFEEVVKAQITILLQDKDETTIAVKKKKATLKLLRNLKPAKPASQEPALKKHKLDPIAKATETKKVSFEDAGADSSDNEDEIAEEKDDDVQDNKEEDIEQQTSDGKRAITYQIAKNKGLMPHRKKEQRNPRVKHRNKFRKAKIRRKGAVRDVRKELKRYGGEISGIKANVTKSIKIKS